MARPKHGDFRIVNKEGTNFYTIEYFIVDNFGWFDRILNRGIWRKYNSKTYQSLENAISTVNSTKEEYEKDKRKREEKLEFDKRPEYVVWESE